MTFLLPTIIGALLGAIFGSFLATLVIRWPESHSAMMGRSRCDHCGTKLAAIRLLPLISYSSQSGQTACCGKPIDPLHPIAEALAMTIGAVSFGLFGWDGYASAILGWLLLTLALFDLRHFILPDWLNASLLLAGLALPITETTLPLTDRLVGALVGYGSLTLIALLYRTLRGREGLGAGDPKLLAAVGAWVGWQYLPMIIIVAGLLGLAVAAMLYLSGSKVNALTRLPLGTLIAVVTWPTWLHLQLVT